MVPSGPAPPATTVVLALLTWNTRAPSLDSLEAHLREARLLTRLGYAAHLCVCDNGSVDGTVSGLRAYERSIDVPHRFIFNKTNRGNCVARNQIIDYALEVHSDYLLFVDGDIELVAFSSIAMLRYMDQCGRRLGCIGADSAGHTTDRALASSSLPAIQPERVQSSALVAWTQYGMFRGEVFADGVRFEESPPFDQPGWGFEDNDLAFQMVMKGYLIQHVCGITYLHRHMRSSVRNLRQQGVDVADICARRREFVLRKWSDVSCINGALLDNVRSADPRI